MLCYTNYNFSVFWFHPTSDLSYVLILINCHFIYHVMVTMMSLHCNLVITLKMSVIMKCTFWTA